MLGSRQERIDRSGTARDHYGNAAYIYNNVYNVTDLVAGLNAFPNGSVSRLIIGGHGTYSGRVGVQPTNNTTALPAGAGFIDSTTIDVAIAGQITTKLTATAEVEFQSCGAVAAGGGLPAETGVAAQSLANRLGRRIWFVCGTARGWDNADEWHSRSPE